jgi:type VI secretion system secreted protein VgrG
LLNVVKRKESCSMKIKLILATIMAVLMSIGVTEGQITIDLGSASSFAVMAGSGITVAGAVNTTTINGDIGTFPTPAITGFGNIVLSGVNQTGDGSLMLNAQNDLSTAFTTASRLSATTSYGPIQDLGGLTLTPGVYYDPSSFGITGTLTLNGNQDSVFIFNMGSTLTAESSSRVVLEGGVQACHVFWIVGSSATLDAGADFTGSILADQSITAGTDATIDGRLLAENGAVTLDNNTITVSNDVPEPSAMSLLFIFGLVSLPVFKYRFYSR